ncbi:hypothetical protein GZH46_02493 [Fragariocoptes setiger]|uniref:Chitin-binding type-2 domain-containing protein n=1 Tax=Fragariocoptes setiger TaxID=1670756 RepID=A0ABQ7S6E4_9ACAR|nr:hypothetical protein GZH46_02493 [Fragariocoptes setiger]
MHLVSLKARLLIAIIVVIFVAKLSHQQQNRRAQASSSSSSSGGQSNNQALRSSVAQLQSQQPIASSTSTRRPQASSRPPANTNTNDDEESDGESGSRDIVKQFDCPRPDGLFADPSTCKKFILCGSGRPWTQSCPPGLWFDSKLKFCTFKTAGLTCGPVGDEEEVRQDEATQEGQDNLPICDKNCKLPNCFCSPDGTSIPGGLQPNHVPQMVLLSFSGAVNELVVDHYKKILGYTTKYNSGQTRLNPNGCGIRATFFVSHDYTSYAHIHWLAAQGHEIGLHSITHRLPELWWTEKANYSDLVEEMIGMREILLQQTNINGDNQVIKREDIIGMRAPYIKPAGDNMFQMINDFGLTYDSSIVAPTGDTPLWPFTLDTKVPWLCTSSRNNKNKNQDNDSPSDGESRHGPSGQRQRRHTRSSQQSSGNSEHEKDMLVRQKRQSPFAGKSLRCPTKAYPGIWEVPINPMSNEFNTCHHLDQCVFPSQDDHSDSSDIVDFLTENFERHYNTTRAPFQLNLHVQFALNNNRVRALTKFIDNISKKYPDVWFVSFKQMIEWMRAPAANNAANVFKCEDPGKICPGITCPKVYPWFGNLLGSERNLKTVLQLVQESTPAEESATGGGDTQPNGGDQTNSGSSQNRP